ncbi:unnamed protein product [Orchesella dallaii]|uniref:C-type lectin domain-containing protein n=1 Tax=Orchesella dallaii TaxID=48710 RepID=A0ABP1PPL9_9HEXA
MKSELVLLRFQVTRKGSLLNFFLKTETSVMRVFPTLLFCYCVLFEDPAVGAQDNEELIPQGLKVLGTVGEKTYLVDTDGVLRVRFDFLILRIQVKSWRKTCFISSQQNWTESKSFCQNRGLTLATITTHNQVEFLKNSYNPTQFNGWYWVNAREGENGNLTWEDTHKPVQEFDTLSTMGWHHEENSGNCLCYSSNNQQNAYYFKHGCFHTHHTLCESFKPIDFIPITEAISQITKSRLMELGSADGKIYFGDHILRVSDD